MSSHTIPTRIIFDCIIAVSVLFGVWFVAWPVAVIAAWYFPLYAEILVAGIAYDALFGMSSGMGIWAYVGTLIAVVSFIAVNASKRILRR